jgi:hypothetical protein
MLQILLSVTLCRVLDLLVARYMKELDHVNAYVMLFATGTRTHQHQPSVDEQTATTKSVQDAAIKDACITHMISGRTWRRWNTDFLSAGSRFIILQSRRLLSFLDVYPEFATAYRKFLRDSGTAVPRTQNSALPAARQDERAPVGVHGCTAQRTK